MSTALELRDVRVEYPGPRGTRFSAVDGVRLSISKGESVAIVGESGCGKTTLARAILGLQPYSGIIERDGKPVRGTHPSQAREVGMVWQNPFASLDAKWTTGRSVQEPLRLLGLDNDLDALFQEVGLDPDFRHRYPHQMSGGQRQRVAIARAIGPRPPLLLCDEPTAALDLSVQAQVLNLLKDLQAATGCAVLYISHDLATVRYIAHRVAVMYLGRIVEIGETEQIFERPQHPYTAMLLEGMLDHDHIGHLPEIREDSQPGRTSKGCLFANRCLVRTDRCWEDRPSLEGTEQHQSACWNKINPS